MLEIMKDNQVFVEDIMHVWCIILFLRTVFHWNLLKIPHRIEGGVTIETAITAVSSFHTDSTDEISQGTVHRIALADGVLLHTFIRHAEDGDAMMDTHARQRTESDKRTVVLTAMIVGTLHQGTLGEQVTHFQVSAYWRMQITQHCFVYCFVVKCFHICLFI